MTTTIARIRKTDRKLVQVNPDGSETVIERPPLRIDRTEEEILAAAMSDPDCRPMTAEERARAQRVPRVKSLRRALRLTQEEFAARYHIPVGTLRDWEQGRTEPDQPARAYLRVIANDPEGISNSLKRGPTPPK